MPNNICCVGNSVLKSLEAPDDIFFYKGFTFFFARKIKWGHVAIETEMVQGGLSFLQGSYCSSPSPRL